MTTAHNPNCPMPVRCDATNHIGVPELRGHWWTEAAHCSTCGQTYDIDPSDPRPYCCQTYETGQCATCAEEDRIEAERLARASDPDLTCQACGRAASDEPTSADEAHDNLCCGTPFCTDPGNCVTHDDPRIEGVEPPARFEGVETSYTYSDHFGRHSESIGHAEYVSGCNWCIDREQERLASECVCGDRLDAHVNENRCSICPCKAFALDPVDGRSMYLNLADEASAEGFDVRDFDRDFVATARQYAKVHNLPDPIALANIDSALDAVQRMESSVAH